jgi:hypothetical protein
MGTTVPMSQQAWGLASFNCAPKHNIAIVFCGDIMPTVQQGTLGVGTLELFPLENNYIL